MKLPAKNGYWFEAEYTSYKTGQTGHSQGGYRSKTAVDALEYARGHVKAVGYVRLIRVYELKEGGEIGSLMISSRGDNDTNEREVLCLPPPEKESDPPPKAKVGEFVETPLSAVVEKVNRPNTPSAH